MSLLESEAVYNAAHVLWSGAWASEYEERGGRFSAGQDVCDVAPRLSEAEHAPIVFYMIGAIEATLGKSMGCGHVDLGLIFHHAGITSLADQSHALADLLMDCCGSGVSIDDDFPCSGKGLQVLGLDGDFGYLLFAEGELYSDYIERELADMPVVVEE